MSVFSAVVASTSSSMMVNGIQCLCHWTSYINPNTTTQEKSNDDIEPSKCQYERTTSVENTVATHDQSHQLEKNSTHHSKPQQLQEDAHPYAYLEVQSRVQIPSSEPGVEYQYGVIHWIGSFRNGKELFAGIELVSPYFQLMVRIIIYLYEM